MLNTAFTAIQLLLICLLGFVLQRSGHLDTNFKNSLSNLQLDVIVPCYVLKSISGMEYSPETLLNCGAFILLSVAVLVVSLILGQLGYIALGRSYRGRLMRYALTFTNVTIFGLPIAESVWGEEALFYFVIFYVPVRFGYYCLSGVLLDPNQSDDKHERLKSIGKLVLSPAVLVCILGVLMYAFQIKLPSLLGEVCASVGSCCKPVGMIIIGVMIGEYNLKSVLKPRYMLIPFFRTMVAPAIFLGLAYLLHLGGLIGRLAVLYSALPCGMLLTAFTLKYSGDPEAQLESAGVVLLSTIIAIITVPLWVTLCDMVLFP